MSDDTHALAALKRYFQFPFQGPEWQQKFLIGAGLTILGYIIPIIPWIFLYGYFISIMRQTIQGDAPSLPVWADWNQLGKDGLRAFLIGFLFLLPANIVLFGGWFFYCMASIILPLATSSDFYAAQDPSGWILIFFMFSLIILMLSIPIGMILGFLGGIPLPVATANLISEDRLSGAFKIRLIWRVLRRNALGYLIAWLLAFGIFSFFYLFSLITIYTIIFACLVPIVLPAAAFYFGAVTSAIFGDAYREGMQEIQLEIAA